MKVLFFIHPLDIGGVQVNAIELAAFMRDVHGHDVLLFAAEGPMTRFATDKGIRCIAAPAVRVHPSMTRMRALSELVEMEKPDVVYAWDWEQCLDAYFGVHLWKRVPLVVTDMSMTMGRVLPKSVPITFGVPALVDEAKRAGRGPVELLLPPVDVEANRPGAVDSSEFLKNNEVQPGEIVMVIVSRLISWMKIDGLRRAVEAVCGLGKELPLRLLIVGEGAAQRELVKRAREVNDLLGRNAITLTGPLLDPRPAYAGADIVIGMGGSALRGMAFAKPVIVVGENGFSAPFTPETADSFYYNGMYGLGDGESGCERLTGDIRQVVAGRFSRQELGAFSREFVVRHFALETVGKQCVQFVESSVRHAAGIRATMSDAARTTIVCAWGRARRMRTRCIDALRASGSVMKAPSKPLPDPAR